MGELLYLKNVVTLHLNQEICIGCGMCVTVCPHEVFSLENGHAVIDNRDACMECGACARNCPEAAVTVKAGVGCAAAVINAALGVKDSSCCCFLEPEDNPCAPESGISKQRCC
ncbi:MAG TPA: mercury methylation ferredoxin HgcB [Desulfobacteraceae bacterium]|nr:mercury methylation ferredoxin HgcB [Desulfobacteraceae bacterium]HPJ67495.1 mercury methylation ferredoxin HgcB [Desulfobacteraceae bacterium]HPQ29825.1 mercury methylation ferredoxin HgcB [Desulfobacteraceae bacterium]